MVNRAAGTSPKTTVYIRQAIRSPHRNTCQKYIYKNVYISTLWKMFKEVSRDFLPSLDPGHEHEPTNCKLLNEPKIDDADQRSI